MNGMTLAAIADTADCGYRTVKTYAKKLWPAISWRNRRLNETEALTLMQALPKRSMVTKGKSAHQEGQIGPSIPGDTIALIVRETVSAILPPLLAALRGATDAQLPKAAPAALPAPAELEPRAALRRIVESHARDHGRDYQGAWATLYREYGYRYRRDIVRAARNRGQSVLDYADAENILGELLALAFFLFGQREEKSA